MKFAVAAGVASLAVTTTRVAADSTDFDKILGLMADLQTEIDALHVLYADKEEEIAALEELCAEDAPATPAPITTEPAPTPIYTEPEPTPTPTREPEPEPQTPAPTSEPEPAPGTPAPTSESNQEPASGGGGGGSGWTPKIGDHWNYNLDTPVDTDLDVEVFFIDMDGAQDTIDSLRSQGKGVVCYISIGTREEWREDADEFPISAVGGEVDGWAGEHWLDTKDKTVRSIMTARVEKAASMGCDAIEPDNMMAYTEGNIGVTVTEEDQIDYNKWFAAECHKHGMSVAMKNAVELVPILYKDFDFALNEECFQWDECEVYEDTFLNAGKPVFNVEYKNNMDQCSKANSMGIDSIVKNLNLNAPMCSCADSSKNLDCDRVI